MNAISYPVIEPIAQRIHEARTRRQSVQLSSDQVTLLDEWMQHELELQADSSGWRALPPPTIRLILSASTKQKENWLR
jgi:hypothetical protein